MAFNIVLIEPEIPNNTGNIGRLSLATGSNLHLVKPFGFEIDDTRLKRAGLDYWFELDVREYDNIEEFWLKNPMSPRHFMATTKTTKNYFEPSYQPDDYFYFGREDNGLPQSMLDKNSSSCITIPMANQARSLNMANSVSIIAYEALRQNFSQFES